MVLSFVDLSTGALILFLGSPRTRLDGHELPSYVIGEGGGGAEWGYFALLRSAEGTDRRRRGLGVDLPVAARGRSSGTRNRSRRLEEEPARERDVGLGKEDTIDLLAMCPAV
jgi:hypothetical protein